MSRTYMTRRDALRLGLASGAGLLATRVALGARTLERLAQMEQLPLITRPIPSSGERRRGIISSSPRRSRWAAGAPRLRRDPPRPSRGSHRWKRRSGGCTRTASI
jgi:hypothetical protein